MGLAYRIFWVLHSTEGQGVYSIPKSDVREIMIANPGSCHHRSKLVWLHFNRHDLDSAVATLTPDFALEDVASGQTFHGPEGGRQWLQGFLTALPDAHAEQTNALVAGDRVFTEHTGTGTHTERLISPNGEIPPTGRSIELQIAELYQLQEDKIALMRAYYDSATLLRQLGLMP